MLARTYDAFSQYLLHQFTNMPKEASTRGGHAYNSYKGNRKKEKNKGKKGKRKWKWNDDESHQGHRSEKRAHSISLSPSVAPSIPATLLSQSVRQYGYGVDKVDTRSLKSHRSSAHNQIHSWSSSAAPTSNEHDINPDPDTYFYCHVHGFNLTHSGPQCAKMKHNPTSYNSAQVQATHPHATSPIGSRRMQKKSDALPTQ
jgi:hypothetical protein